MKDLIGNGQAKFETWKNEYGDTFSGMRHIENGHQHGIVREVKEGGYFWEGTFMNGEVTGLLIGYFKNFTKVFMYKGGKKTAQFSFNSDFVELNDEDHGRQGTDLNMVTPANFKGEESQLTR